MPSIRSGALTPLALVILKLLHERPMHPYEMQQVIQERHLHQYVKVRAGSLYHTVERLDRLGLIHTVETTRAGRRPERTVYAISQDGRDEYRDGLVSALRHPIAEYPRFGSAVEMLGMLDPSEATSLLGHRMVELEARIASLEQVATSLTKRGTPRIHLIEAEYAASMLRAELTWVSAIVDDIESAALCWQPATTRPTAARASAADPAATQSTDAPTSATQVSAAQTSAAQTSAIQPQTAGPGRP